MATIYGAEITTDQTTLISKRDSQVNIIGAFLAQPAHHQMIDGVQFERERQVAAITEQGHFKDAQHVDARHLIYPAGIGEVIPHLPEKASDQYANKQADHRAPVT